MTIYYHIMTTFLNSFIRNLNFTSVQLYTDSKKVSYCNPLENMAKQIKKYCVIFFIY